MERWINMTTDSVCVAFTLLVLIYLRTNQDRGEKLNRLFALICVFNLGMLLGDLPDWLFRGFGKPWYPAALWGGSLVLYLSGILIVWVYTLYLHAFLANRGAAEGWVLRVVHVLCGLGVSLDLLNLINGMFYQIDAHNEYHRGEWYWLSQSLPVLVLLLDGGVIVWNRRRLKPKEMAAFLCYLMLPLVGVAIQMQFYGVTTTYLCSTLALFIIFLCIQSEQRLLSEQNKRALEQAQVLLMLSQIQPHFLYNSLLGIKQLCDTAPQKASEALEHFSYYLRGNLDSLADSALIPFAKEMEHVGNYLYLEQMRFSKKLQVEFRLDFEEFQLPPLTIQPLVENAVRHGITKKKGGGLLTICSEKQQGNAVISIRDNGVGFDPEAVPQGSGTHVGLNNVNKRLELQCAGSLQVNSSPGKGTEILVTLPLLQEGEHS